MLTISDILLRFENLSSTFVPFDWYINAGSLFSTKKPTLRLIPVEVALILSLIAVKGPSSDTVSGVVSTSYPKEKKELVPLKSLYLSGGKAPVRVVFPPIYLGAPRYSLAPGFPFIC